MMIINNIETEGYREDMAAPGKSLGLYIHVPFCMKKCNYCDFLSFAGSREEDHRQYFRSLLREIRLNSKIYSNKYYVDSIFIGGGTPSLVEADLIRELIAVVRDCFSVAQNAEISIESNPKTLTEEKLGIYLEAGVNRLSIGAQSFDDELLNRLGRVHCAEDLLKNYSLARACGFRNINLDLMFSVPGQTEPVWLDTLEQATALGPEHISFYGLQLEEGTLFSVMHKEGRLKETDDETDRSMYYSAVKLLKEKGYVHYEISNAAMEGYQCRHNLKYWSMDDYLGLGLGAHSFLGGVRYSNTDDLAEYIRIGNNIASQTSRNRTQKPESPFTVWRHQNTKEENMSEYLFTGLRKRKGIELADFKERFGAAPEEIYGDVLKKYQKSGLIEIDGGCLRLTEKGVDISNGVLAEFI